MLFSSGSIPAVEQQQSFRKTSPALKHWWIKCRMIFQHLKQKHTGSSTQLPRHGYVAVCRQKYRHFLQLRSHYSERDFHDRLENGMRLRFLHPPSCFLTFSAFPFLSCGSNMMFYFACREYAKILFNVCLSRATPRFSQWSPNQESLCLTLSGAEKLPYVKGLPSIAGKTK